MKIKKMIIIAANSMQFCWPSVPEGRKNLDKKFIYVVVWRGCEEDCTSFREYIAGSGLNAEIILRHADRDKSKLSEFVQEYRY